MYSLRIQTRSSSRSSVTSNGYSRPVKTSSRPSVRRTTSSRNTPHSSKSRRALAMRTTRFKTTCAAIGVGFVVAFGAPSGGRVLAHHSFAAEFDITKPVTLTGKVTKIEWTNPHAFLFLDVPDKQTG